MFLFLKEQHERHFHLKFMYFCSPIEKNNPKGWIINALKGKIKDK